MPNSITRLLLVDDHAMLVEVLRDRLNEEPHLEVVATCTTGKAALEK
ncbi:MAG: DNA-binding response regulator, partial [Synechococcaceae cyanobacterium SM2_3_60]|nr:DNA-binding response regulator [Synechococcaceae cyanobacterium SM2_3_60]